MKVGFTGSSSVVQGLQFAAFKKLLKYLNTHRKITEFHHGCCINWDDVAHNLVVQLFDDQILMVLHPPTNQYKMAKNLNAHKFEWRKPKPFLVRNHDIVDDTDCLIGCPAEMEEVLRSGTWSTLRYSRKQKQPNYVVWPNGKVVLTNSLGKTKEINL